MDKIDKIYSSVGIHVAGLIPKITDLFWSRGQDGPTFFKKLVVYNLRACWGEGPCQKNFPSIKENENVLFYTWMHFSVEGMLYNSTDKSDLSEHFQISWCFFKIPKISEVPSAQFSKPHSSTLHFDISFFPAVLRSLLKIMWKGIFAHLFHSMHRTKNLFQPTTWGIEEEHNLLESSHS